MKPIQIVRIEHNDGIGMFNTSTGTPVNPLLPKLYERHFISDNSTKEIFPNPYGDENIDVNFTENEWYCAFKSLEQLNKFIYPEEIKILLEEGYSILLLSVTDYSVGKYQVIYTKESITKQELINSLFK